MITEDYISYETAKLLKEKGFDGQCHMSIGKNEQGEMLAKGTDWDDSFILCPTLQMATKWLKEVHNIHIQALRYPTKVKRDAESSEYSKPWFYKYTFLTELEDIDTDFYGEEEFETSEEAIEEGIKYCLENLI